MSEARQVLIDLPNGTLVKFKTDSRDKSQISYNRSELFLWDSLKPPTTKIDISPEKIYMVVSSWPEQYFNEWTGRTIIMLLDDEKVQYFLCTTNPLHVFEKLN